MQKDQSLVEKQHDWKSVIIDFNSLHILLSFSNLSAFQHLMTPSMFLRHRRKQLQVS